MCLDEDELELDVNDAIPKEVVEIAVRRLVRRHGTEFTALLSVVTHEQQLTELRTKLSKATAEAKRARELNPDNVNVPLLSEQMRNMTEENSRLERLLRDRGA